MNKVFSALFLLAAVTLRAVNPAPYTEAVNLSAKLTGSCVVVATVYGETTGSFVTDTTQAESDMATTWLKPGRSYNCSVQFNVFANGSTYSLGFIIPNGYRLLVNGVPRDMISVSSNTGWSSTDYTLELQPVADLGAADTASFSGIELGRSVSWNFGLGTLRTGRSAGRVYFREQDCANSPTNRARLYYAPPSNVGQITVVRDGSSGQVLRQVMVPQALIDITDLSGDPNAGFQLAAYTPSQGTWNGSSYTVGGQPWRTVRFEPTGTPNQLRVTETEGAVVRVSLLTAPASSSGAYQWTLQEGDGAGNWERTTTHNSTTTSTPPTGGTISYSGGFSIHAFTSSGTFVTTRPLAAEVLVVGGGGGGGGGLTGVMNAGGGGAGGVLYSTSYAISAGSYAVSVGAGGGSGTNGGNSSFSTLLAVGGGHGAHAAYAAWGANGGSGGGAGTAQGAGSGSGTTGQGNAGGPGTGGPYYAGGGGGGATSASYGLDGGSGFASSITGSPVYYGGGGGGGTNNTVGGSGGQGGGATGGGSSSYQGGNGAPNTGGGGGGSSQWSSTGGSGGSGIVVIRYPTGNISARNVVVEVRTGGTSGTVVSKTKYVYETPGNWGEEVTQVVADPDGDALSTVYSYYSDSNARGDYRHVRSMTYPTGAWVAFDYYDDWDRRGQVYREFRPWFDSPAAVATNAGQGCVEESNYALDWTGRFRALSSQVETIGAVQTKSVTRTTTTSTSPAPRETASQNASVSATAALNSERTWYRGDADPDYAGLPISTRDPNSSATSWSYSRGTFNAATKAFSVSGNGDFWREVVMHGTMATDASYGAPESVSGFNGQSCDSIRLIAYKSTADVMIRSPQGYVLRTETHVYTGGGIFSLATWEDYGYDAYGHLTQRVANNGATSTWTYANGRLASSTDASGIETQFSTYDGIGRLKVSIKKGIVASGSYAEQKDVSTTVTYDGAGHALQTIITGDTLTLTSSATYDLAGRMRTSMAPGGYVTSFTPAAGGRIVTTTLPGGATKTDEAYLDGQPKSTTGTGVVAQYFTASVGSGNGFVTRQVNNGTAASSNLVKTTNDWLGRVVTEVRPGWNGSDVVTSYAYDQYSGLLTKVSKPGFADTNYAYDTLGRRVREWLDVNANGTLDTGSSDRISEYNAYYFTSQASWYLEKTTKLYASSGSGSQTQIAKQYWQLSNLPAGTLSSSRSYDVFSNEIATVQQVDRANKLVTTNVTYPDSSVTAQQISRNGLAVSSRDKTNLTTTLAYDALGRQISSTDPRLGKNKTVYVAGTGQIDKFYDAYATQQLAGNPSFTPTQAYHYDSAGRVDWTADTAGKKSYTAYTARNEVYRQWGDAAIPVEYGYDTWGRRTTMKTFRGGTGWTGATWPASPGAADTTTWNFHEATGLLASKVDAASKSVDYTYTQVGQVYTRQWARYVSGTSGPRVTATYAYFNTGELSSVTYNDGTPSVSYTYNRIGSTDTVTDATGTRTFNYNLGATLELQSEDLPSYFGSRRVTYPHATSGAVIGRSTGLQLGTSGSPAGEQSVVWGYDTYGRFSTVGVGGISLTYTYTANSNLLASLSDTASGWTQTRTFLPNRDLLDVIEGKVGAASVGRFDYGYDELGRRTSVRKTSDSGATLYGRYGNGTEGLTTTFGYDDRSQVTSEVTTVGTSPTVLNGRNDAYAYDNFGNRASIAGTTHNSAAAGYTTNALNQYTVRTVPGTADVAGAATAGTTVTVSSSGGPTRTASRHGQYFFDGYPLDNSANPIYRALTVSDGSSSQQLLSFVSKTPEVMAYDADGNLTSDGRWDYAFDAENRLVSVQTHTSLSPSPLPNSDARRVEFTYDYLGRRVQKIVRSGYNGSTFATAATTRYIYDGWNLLAEYSVSGSTLALVRSFTWGLDWSGTLQGAGGVGGLLLIAESGQTYQPFYDGNGNLMGLTKRSDGSLVAAYEYDAFGQTIRESGAYAASNPFRFSTKYTDLDIGLVYYGLRYYNPSLGRFINRDPKEEGGGLNLYAFCLNNAVNAWDYLGMDGEGFGAGWTDSQWDSYNRFIAGYYRAMDDSYGRAQAWQQEAYGKTVSNMMAGLAAGTIQYGSMQHVWDTPSGSQQSSPKSSSEEGPSARVEDRTYTRNADGTVTMRTDAGATTTFGAEFVDQAMSGNATYVSDIYGVATENGAANIKLAPFKVVANPTTASAPPVTVLPLEAYQQADQTQAHWDGRSQAATNQALTSAMDSTFNNDVFKKPIETLLTAATQETALVGASYTVVAGGIAAYPAARAAVRPISVAVRVALIAKGADPSNATTSTALRYLQYAWYQGRQAIVEVVTAAKPPPGMYGPPNP